MPDRNVSNAANTAGRGCNKLAQYRANRRSEQQVGIGHDSRANRGLSAVRRDLASLIHDELNFTDGFERVGFIRPVMCMALDKHRSANILRADVGQKIGGPVAEAPLWEIPQVMMRIDHRPRRVAHLLGVQSKPLGPYRYMGVLIIGSLGRRNGCCHVSYHQLPACWTPEAMRSPIGCRVNVRVDTAPQNSSTPAITHAM